LNRIPEPVRQQVIQLALDEPALSPRDLAARFTDTQRYFVSEASVCRLLKTADLIASPAFIVIKAAGGADREGWANELMDDGQSDAHRSASTEGCPQRRSGIAAGANCLDRSEHDQTLF